MISSQSALLLVILASSLILTCHSQIKLTPCLNLVIFISETSVVFVISFLFLQLQRLPIHSSKLDYCNSLYNGISQANLNKIQRIQNTLARVVTNTSKFERITPILKKLHWLPIKQRIDYKLCLLTNKTLQIQQPTYLYNSLSFPSHSLSTRSSDSSVLSIYMSEHLWVKEPFLSLLQDSETPSHQTPVTRYLFLHSVSKLKTHLFKLAFPLEFSPILSSDCLPGFDSCFSFTFSPVE